MTPLLAVLAYLTTDRGFAVLNIILAAAMGIAIGATYEAHAGGVL